MKKIVDFLTFMTLQVIGAMSYLMRNFRAMKSKNDWKIVFFCIQSLFIQLINNNNSI